MLITIWRCILKRSFINLFYWRQPLCIHLQEKSIQKMHEKRINLSCSQQIDQLHADKIPTFMHEFFEMVTDVPGDDHYGFCEVVGLHDMFVDDYQITRYELLKELTGDDGEYYLWSIGSEKRFDKVKHAVTTGDVLALLHRINECSCRIWIFSLHKDISMWWFYCQSIKSNHKPLSLYAMHVRIKTKWFVYNTWMTTILWWYNWRMVVQFLTLSCYGDNTIEMAQSHEMLYPYDDCL